MMSMSHISTASLFLTCNLLPRAHCLHLARRPPHQELLQIHSYAGLAQHIDKCLQQSVTGLGHEGETAAVLLGKCNAGLGFVRDQHWAVLLVEFTAESMEVENWLTNSVQSLTSWYTAQHTFCLQRVTRQARQQQADSCTHHANNAVTYHCTVICFREFEASVCNFCQHPVRLKG